MITINSRKYDGSIHRSWSAELVDNRGKMLICSGVFDERVEHPDLGIIEIGTYSREYYWLDRWYNVFKFMNPDGSFRNFYCNLTLPPKFEGKELDFIDLDIDVLVSVDWKVNILDEEEFEKNKETFHYPAKLIQEVGSNTRLLLNMIKNQDFPFGL